MEHAGVYLAIDLGAESGRVVAGSYDGDRLEMDEVHRFSNGPVEERDGLHWDMKRLYAEVGAGISVAGRRFGSRLVSVGVDSWGVDYGLVDRQGAPLGNPFHYRDPRTEAVFHRVVETLGRGRIFESTGVQFMPINTVYQLVAEKESLESRLPHADRLLFIPDLFNHWLTGLRTTDRTMASTSQLYNPRTRSWAADLLAALEIRAGLLCDPQDAGTIIGPIRKELASELGVPDLPVVLVGTHDTASAVAAVPVETGTWAYISSGTWSLMGVEVPSPIISPRTLQIGLGNEVGVCDTVRLLKNIAGLWLLQQCRSWWARGGGKPEYDDLVAAARSAPPFSAAIDPNHPGFAAPGDMPRRIEEYCAATGQRPPAGRGAMVRAILESLAFSYRRTLDRLQEVCGHRIEVVHIVGGGARNALLDQLTADALGRPVVAGPAEATAVGNILMQLHAIGEIGSLQEGRDIVRRSFKPAVYHPTDTAAWQRPYEVFLERVS